jgi:hypothetical protein|tara:strand:- start:2451 stop:2612 length:162 start_codon:yes stop_codon:yes gene_type:complete
LYDLKSDLTESNNLAVSKPEKLKSMLEAIVKGLESKGALYPLNKGKPIKPVIP